jgi:hypothetical protein
MRSSRLSTAACLLSSAAFVLLVAAGAARCGGSTGATTARAAESAAQSTTAASSGTAGTGTGNSGGSGAAAGAAAPHGDHTPHHARGTVLMHRDLHYEIVLEPSGRVAVYLTDAVRKDLPASLVADVTIEIDRPKRSMEAVDMAIDANGECWEGKGRPVKEDDATVRVAFTFQGESLSVELPYRSYWKAAAPPTPTAAAAPGGATAPTTPTTPVGTR